jgi:hypothetical protein
MLLITKMTRKESKMPRRKNHQIVIAIETDKACSLDDAVKIVQECAMGDYYPAVCDNEAGVEQFDIIAVKKDFGPISRADIV